MSRRIIATAFLVMLLSANFAMAGPPFITDDPEQITLGGEIFHETSAAYGSPGHTAFNVGGYYNFNEHQHLLLSVGRDIDGPVHLAFYLGFQLTY